MVMVMSNVAGHLDAGGSDSRSGISGQFMILDNSLAILDNQCLLQANYLATRCNPLELGRSSMQRASTLS